MESRSNVFAYLPGEEIVMEFTISGYSAIYEGVEAWFTNEQGRALIKAEGIVSQRRSEGSEARRQVAAVRYSVRGEDAPGFYELTKFVLNTAGGRADWLYRENLNWPADVGFRVDQEPNIGPSVRILVPEFSKG